MRARMSFRAAGLFLALIGHPSFSQDSVKKSYANDESLEKIYEDLHRHPELSHWESHTSGLLADALRQAGYTVTEDVGRYEDGTRAHGVVALLKNGPGLTVLVRADMDALPLREETGLPYRSTVIVNDDTGSSTGVMHACGHDLHMAVLIGTARELAANRSSWHGTVMLIGQPSEEILDGARAMLDDGLYERFGTPAMALALHDTNLHPSGTIAITSGPATSSSTAVDVILRGIGGHGAAPHLGKDPIVMAANFIVQLQTIVSREESPFDPSVVTVGDIHGGTKRNVIPDEVRMELTTRAFSEKARTIILDGIRNAAQGVALASGVPADRAPIVRILDQQSAPVTINDPALVDRLTPVWRRVLGDKAVLTDPPVMASEDFGRFGLAGHRIPTLMFWLGAMNPSMFTEASDKGTLLPGMHNSHFEIDPSPAIRTGVLAMSSAVQALLQ